MSLKREAAAWKNQYSQNLHDEAKKELDGITHWMQEMNRHLKREINDLDDVRLAMKHLTEIREKEAMLDWEFQPVQDKYQMRCLMRLRLFCVHSSTASYILVLKCRRSWARSSSSTLSLVCVRG